MTAPLLHCTAVGCVLRPGHTATCLPTPRPVMLCVPCHGRGNSDSAATDWTCTHCWGTGTGPVTGRVVGLWRTDRPVPLHATTVPARESFDEEMNRLAREGVPNIDNAGDGTVDGPDACDCAALPGEHTEDQCAGLYVRCSYEPDDPHQIVGGLCRDCDWHEDHPHTTRRTA